jgi:hypothetical protein
MVDALGESNGRAVDWWLIQKLPQGLRSKNRGPTTSGTEYLYYESDGTAGLQLSPHKLGQPLSALTQTLESVFGRAASAETDLGWIRYCIEGAVDAGPKSQRPRSHGLLCFNHRTNRGLWLVHTLPFSPLQEELTSSRLASHSGFAILCVTLKNYAAANRVARQIITTRSAIVTGSYLPRTIPKQGEIRDLAKSTTGLPGTRTYHALSFRSRHGQKFQMMTRTRGWEGDIWLKSVEARTKAHFGIRKMSKTEALSMKFDLTLIGEYYQWDAKSDWVNWTISTMPDWVCIGNLAKKGNSMGMPTTVVGFEDPRLWLDLRSIRIST